MYLDRFKLTDRTALVTGGASGIGAACAEILAREGASVIIADVQDDKGRELAHKIGGKAEYQRLDVTSEDAWEALVKDVFKRHGRLDILVNNAGIGVGSPSITTMSLEDWRRQQAVNVEGVFLGTKHCLRLMRKAGNGGAIVNMSSVAGLKGSPTLAGYSATKGAVRLFTKSIALECAAAKDGVRVNSVHPGIIETPIWEGIMGGRPGGVNSPPDLDAISTMAVPLGVKGLPEDIANAVLWLSCDESRYVTGAEMVVDGGLSVR
jgi:NAD(P)-dependent dehydrogenase (short-subunit alcohol dehydrogenase family)